MESLYGEENKGKTEESIGADCDIVFSWFGPSANAINHAIKEWNPQFKGAILIALATTYLQGSDTYYTMTDNGDIKAVTGLGAARLGVDDDNQNKKILSTIQEYDNWAFVTQYPYKASMTTLGVPCEVPMTGKIRVIAKMGTENHLSSGIYMVLGKTDKISSSGFFSEFELFKFVSGFNPNYTINQVPEEEDDDDTPATGPDKNNDGTIDIRDGVGPRIPTSVDEYTKSTENTMGWTNPSSLGNNPFTKLK
jgi:hypothetical protein